MNNLDGNKTQESVRFSLLFISGNIPDFSPSHKLHMLMQVGSVKFFKVAILVSILPLREG